MCRTATRFFGPDFLPTTDGALYTVPDGCKAIIRNIQIRNTGGTYIFSVGADASDTELAITPVSGQTNFETFLVLNAGESINGHSSAADSTLTIICGELLSA